MILFHPHKSSFQVCLGIAVPVFSHDPEAFFISHQTLAEMLQFLIQLLDLRFSFSFSINELYPFSSGNRIKVLLQLQDFKRRAVINLNDCIICKFFML